VFNVVRCHVHLYIVGLHGQYALSLAGLADNLHQMLMAGIVLFTFFVDVVVSLGRNRKQLQSAHIRQHAIDYSYRRR